MVFTLLIYTVPQGCILGIETSGDDGRRSHVHFNGSFSTKLVVAMILPILPVCLKANGKNISTYVLLDSGS